MNRVSFTDRRGHQHWIPIDPSAISASEKEYGAGENAGIIYGLSVWYWDTNRPTAVQPTGLYYEFDRRDLRDGIINLLIRKTGEVAQLEKRDGKLVVIESSPL